MTDKEKITMYELFKVWDRIQWYCNWYFWRDNYDTKICVLVTKGYAVFESIEWEYEGKACVLNDTNIGEIIQDWKVK